MCESVDKTTHMKSLTISLENVNIIYLFSRLIALKTKYLSLLLLKMM